jgi:glutathione S-transferase
MAITITAFATSPDRGRGLARDMPVRWALEEVDQRYDVRLVTFAEMKESAHLGLQPFGQIPTYEDDGLVLFESAAIVAHIAQRYDGLLPADATARAHALSWLFAAVSTIEPPIVERSTAILTEGERSWAAERLPLIEARISKRLEALSAYLGDSAWLDRAFSAADLMMVTVLRRLGCSGLLERYPNLAAYVARGEARPAFERAFAAQLAVFTASEKASV